MSELARRTAEAVLDYRSIGISTLEMSPEQRSRRAAHLSGLITIIQGALTEQRQVEEAQFLKAAQEDDEERAALRAVLTELLRLYDWRFELAKLERDGTTPGHEVSKLLRRYGEEKKAAWTRTRALLNGAMEPGIITDTVRLDHLLRRYGHQRWDGTIGRPATFNLHMPSREVPGPESTDRDVIDADIRREQWGKI